MQLKSFVRRGGEEEREVHVRSDSTRIFFQQPFSLIFFFFNMDKENNSLRNSNVLESESLLL